MKAVNARILLTGANGGIGQASALALLKGGAAVMLVGRSPAAMATLARTLEATAAVTADRIAWHAADLRQPAEIDSLADAARRWRCNVLVHNAGVASFGRFEAMRAAEMAEVMQINLLAPMQLTHALLPLLREMPAAQVICIGSALGRLGLPGYSVYSASKFGLRGFAEALRRELGDTTVRVQYLGPRSTRTAFNTEAAEAYNRATGTASDTPERVAQALLDLLESGQAERFLGFPETLAVRINGMVPALLDGAFKKHRDSLPHVPPITQIQTQE